MSFDKLYFAQLTQLPNNGASNAEDFQPQTRNPQTAPGNLQPVTGAQQTSPQDVLSQSNTRIVVPSNPADPPEVVQPVSTGGGINWVFVFVSTAIIVFVAERFFRKRDSRNQSLVVQELVTIEQPEQPEVEEVKINESQAQESHPDKVVTEEKPTTNQSKTKKPAKNKKKKSKSKRKRR